MRRLTTKNLFYLELKRNQQFYRLLAEEITIRLPAPPMTNGNNYEKTFALKLFGSHTTRIVISIQLQIKYIWQIKVHFEVLVFPLLTPTTLINAMVVLSLQQHSSTQWWSCLSNNGGLLSPTMVVLSRMASHIVSERKPITTLTIETIVIQQYTKRHL
jgi:hypothetical protein